MLYYLIQKRRIINISIGNFAQYQNIFVHSVLGFFFIFIIVWFILIINLFDFHYYIRWFSIE